MLKWAQMKNMKMHVFEECTAERECSHHYFALHSKWKINPDKHVAEHRFSSGRASFHVQRALQYSRSATGGSLHTCYQSPARMWEVEDSQGTQHFILACNRWGRGEGTEPAAFKSECAHVPTNICKILQTPSLKTLEHYRTVAVGQRKRPPPHLYFVVFESFPFHLLIY